MYIKHDVMLLFFNVVLKAFNTEVMILEMWNLNDSLTYRIIIAKVLNLLGPGMWVPAVKSNNFSLQA